MGFRNSRKFELNVQHVLPPCHAEVFHVKTPHPSHSAGLRARIVVSIPLRSPRISLYLNIPLTLAYFMATPEHMTVLQSIIIGIVEGLTEFLPVSSTGHIMLAQRMLGISKGATSDAFSICVQAGAIIAVLALYFHRVKGMLLGFLGKDQAGLALGLKVLVAFFPAVVLGLLFDDLIETHLLRMNVVAIAWLVGGILILLVVGKKKDPEAEAKLRPLEDLTYMHALLIGLLQCVAMMPGTSRSLITIVAGLLVGLRLAAAVEFSFLLGLLTLSGASAYKGLKHGGEMLENYGPVVIIAGCIAAAVSAFISVKWMVSYLQKHSFAIFGHYRIAIGGATLILIALGHLSGE